MKVLIPYPEETVKIIRDIIGNEANVVRSERTVESMLSTGGDADIIATGRVPAEYIQSAKSLKMIQGFGAGIEKIDREAVLERGDIIVCNSHLNAAEVAEYTIMLLLALAKHITISDHDMRKGDWRLAWGGPFPNTEIRNKTCLIVGLGNIGAEVAKRLRSFDVTIHAATRTGTSPQSDLADKVVRIDEVKDSVKIADFVILTLPLTEESANLIDGQFISWMKQESLFVNISRGAIVDEGALYHALKEHRIGGAAIDVWWTYPAIWGGSGQMPSEKFPFHELDNVVLSPHRAAFSENIERDQIRFVGENILRFIRGEKPQNIVDMTLGY